MIVGKEATSSAGEPFLYLALATRWEGKELLAQEFATHHKATMQRGRVGMQGSGLVPQILAASQRKYAPGWLA